MLAKGGNTSNLMAHLKEHHPTLYAEALSAQPALSKIKGAKAKEQDKSQSTIETAIKSASKYSPNSPQVLELNHAVAYYTAKDAQPFAAVERQGFRAMWQSLTLGMFYLLESTLLSWKYLGSTVK